MDPFVESMVRESQGFEILMYAFIAISVIGGLICYAILKLTVWEECE